jgi:putative oxidoreductase
MFFTHGADKLFAWFGREAPVELMSRFGVAGVLETFGGLLIILGLFTRPTAFILSGQMAVAYFWIHAADGLFWWGNGGELAAMYCWGFLLLAAFGAGEYSVDGVLAKRKATPAG